MRPRQVLHVITAIAIVAGAVTAYATGFGTPDVPGRAHRIAGGLQPHDASSWSAYVPANDPVPTTSAPTTSLATTTTTTAAPTTGPPVSTAAPTTAPTTAAPTTTSTTTPPGFTPQLVARLTTDVVQVYAQPGDVDATEALYDTTEFGNPRVLPVSQLGGDWLEVALPTRPNSSEGWIRARDAKISSVVDSVSVSIASHTLVWTHGGVVKLTATVATGAPTSPTPPGFFFVTDIFPTSPTSEYGAWVIALNGHSDAFTEFEGGDARIAIHGTNDPASIGKAASAGCVRLAADPLSQLAHALPPGTPVTIS